MNNEVAEIEVRKHRRATPPSPWPAFQRKLADTLGALEEDQYLVVSAKRGWAYVQFVAQGSYGMRAECMSNSYLDEAHALSAGKIEALERLGWAAPTRTAEEVERGKKGGSPNFHRDFERPVPFDDAARMGVATLADVFEIPHPGLLTYKAFDRSGLPILVPTLGLKREVPASVKEATPKETAASLKARVLAAIRKASGKPGLKANEEGDIPLRFDRAVVIVRVLEDPLCVRLFAPLLENAEGGDLLVDRLNELNASVRFVRLFAVEGTVIAAAEVPASPLVEAHVTRLCQGLGAFAEEKGAELRKEFGGRTPFERSPGEARVQ